MKYTQRQDGEAFALDRRGDGKWSHRIACCDCGLTHDFAFILEGKRLYMAAKRNVKATNGRRNARKRRDAIAAAIRAAKGGTK